MKKAFGRIYSRLDFECDTYHISRQQMLAQLLLPVFISVLFAIGWFFPPTHRYALWMAKENHPVEILTFLFALWASMLGFSLVRKLSLGKREPLARVFLSLFALGLFWVAMEEISWGQDFLHFETPAAIAAVNIQGETTIHNLKGLQGESEWFHLSFGLGGLMGCLLKVKAFRLVRVPVMLTSWFATISLIALLDLSTDSFSSDHPLQYFMRRFSEVNEMLIGIAGFLYLGLLTKKLRGSVTAALPTEVSLLNNESLDQKPFQSSR